MAAELPKQPKQRADSSTSSRPSRPTPDLTDLNPRRSGDGTARTGDATGSRNSSGVSNPARPAPASDDPSVPTAVAVTLAARETWAKIGDDFVHNRATSRHKAFKQLQLDVMRNCAILSPDYLSPKDIVGMSMDIEKFLKENPEETGAGKSTLDIVSDWLREGDVAASPSSMTEHIV